MTCCSHCKDAGDFFGGRTARRELRRYRRRGPSKPTRLLLDALQPEASGATLLDIGGGIGALQHELFRSGLQGATQVEASPAYLEAAREEGERLGNASRTAFVHGDFVEAAPGLAPADLVTLDRVICCYPHLEALLEASMGRARRLLGLVYPRQRRGTRLAMTLGNLWLRLRGSAFRVYLHSPERVDALLREGGFRSDREGRTFLWEVRTYRRVGQG